MATSLGWKTSLTTLVRRNRHRRPTERRRLPRFDFCEPRTLMTTGAIYTTLSTGATVNANIYDVKEDVYLNGGPQNTNAQGLTPGTYYFQVTNPNGDLLLSTDPAVNRIVVVNEYGVFANDQPLTTHNLGSFNAANQSRPVQLMPFANTDNPGGEYKAWLISTEDATPRVDDPNTPYDESRILDFKQGADVKTDNFKVKSSMLAPWAVTLGGQKFEDFNGDGVFGAGESGLAGVVIDVQLTLPDDSTIDLTTTTGDQGLWSVTALLPAGVTPAEVTFTAREEQPAGYTQTAPLDTQTTADATATDFVWRGRFDATSDNDTATGLDFGNFKNFRLSGTKYTDTNGDGKTAGDSGLGGVLIYIDANNNGSLDPGETSTTTAADGTWSIDNLDFRVAGMAVREVLPSGYTQTLGMAGYPITGTSGADQAGLDFANFKNFRLSGTKYTDTNGDGKTAGDSGLGGVLIYIDANNNGSLDPGETSTTTAADGTWSIDNLDFHVAGMAVREVLPSGYTQTLGMAGYPITGTSGADQAGLDFANFKNFRLSGTKYTDTNGDGKTAGDSGLGGVLIYIDANNNGSLDPGETSTTTAADGTWSIDNLDFRVAGMAVREVLPFGYTQTLGMAGYPITGTSGADQTGLNFANFKNVTITGLKYYDYDGNGVWANTAAEPAIARWTLYIDANINGVKDSDEAATLTNANGNFQFSNLGPGTYRVREVLPANWSATQGSGGYDILVGGAGVPSGGTASGYRFGNFRFTPVTGGFTLGFWSNKNGLSRILKTYGTEAAAVADLSNNLNLRNPDGSAFNPTTLAAFQTWLLNASATNMQSMLSAQLAATYLNVKSGSMNGNAIIQLSGSFAGSTYAQILTTGFVVPGTPPSHSAANVVNGCISVNDLIAAANQALSVNTPTIGASAARTYQEALKNLLDALNNNGTASGVSLKFVIAVDPLKVLHVDTDGDGVNDRYVVTLGDGI